MDDLLVRSFVVAWNGGAGNSSLVSGAGTKWCGWEVSGEFTAGLVIRSGNSPARTVVNVGVLSKFYSKASVFLKH
jgi:hypothetical protein